MLLLDNYELNITTIKKKLSAFHRGVNQGPLRNSSWDLLKLGDNSEHHYFPHSSIVYPAI